MHTYNLVLCSCNQSKATGTDTEPCRLCVGFTWNCDESKAKHTTYLSSDDCFKGQYRRVKRKGKARQGKARPGLNSKGTHNTQHRDNTIQVQYTLVHSITSIQHTPKDPTPPPAPAPAPAPTPKRPRRAPPWGTTQGQGLEKGGTFSNGTDGAMRGLNLSRSSG